MVAPNEAEPVWQPNPPQPEMPGETEVGLDGAPIETTENPVAPSEQRAAPAARRHGGARRASSSSLLLVVSALVALGGVGFAVGRATSSGQTDTSQSNVSNAGQFPGPNASGDFSGLARVGAAGSTSVSGTVVSVSADSITLKLANGQTVQVATGSSTTYHGQSAAAITDVTTGASVTIQTAAGPAADASAGTNAGASPGALNGTRTATDVTITAK
ncbi:MAG: hypothetical protein ACXWNR_08690 [Candidatus Limnocylindrales bacterium]